jgi:hypothetical protein
MFSQRWSTAAAGFTTKLPFRWHPASWLSESYIIGRRTWQSFVASIGLACVLFGVVLLPYPGCYIAWLAALTYLLPLWHIFLDTLKRDHTVKSRRIILYQPKSPLNSKVERKTDSNGRLVEVAPTVYWFMDRSDMENLAGASADDMRLLGSFRIAAGFYKAKVSTEFLQLFDSLGLYPSLVDHANSKPMLAVEELARYFEGSRDGKVLPFRRTSDVPMRSVNAGRNPAAQRVREESGPDDNHREQPDPETLSRLDDEGEEREEAEEPTPGGSINEVATDHDPDGVDREERDESSDRITTEQAQDLDSVRRAAIVLPSATAAGTPGRAKGGPKPLGGRKKVLQFKKKPEPRIQSDGDN